MTTNKPEVVRYCVKRDREPWERSNNYYLSPNPDENYTVLVIRLSDYERLQAEMQNLKSELMTVKKVAHGNIELLEENKTLQAECENLRRDAERYRWITSHYEWTEYVEYAICEDGRKPVIDAAIDAAISAYRKQGGDT